MAHVNFGSQYKRLVQFFWDPEPKNDDPSLSPIWCLGRKYVSDTRSAKLPASEEQRRIEDEEQTFDRETVVVSSGRPHAQLKSCDPDGGVMVVPSGSEEERGWPPDFLDDFESRFWFTYRSHFSPIQRSTDSSASSSITLAVRLRSQLVDQGGFTSDTGWGCMIRSGQCLIANALAILELGRDWRTGNNSSQERKLISLFADDPEAPFSLHRFVGHGAAQCGKHPGEWFGPSATARCIQALSQQYSPCGLKVYVTGDGPDVYEDSLLRLAKDSKGTFHPVLILAGIRLGIDRVTPVYWDALRRLLQLSQSVGIAGGRPSASHYFVGVQGNTYFYLDPHQTRPMLPYFPKDSNYLDEDIASCHTRRLRRLHVDKMDPSMLIAFLIRDEEDWRGWKRTMNETSGKQVLHIADSEPQSHNHGLERESAIDEVETLDDEDHDEEDGELINLPTPG